MMKRVKENRLVPVRRSDITKRELGFDPDRNRPIYSKEWHIHKEESAIVKRIFKMYATGNYSMQKIAEILTKEGHRTKFGKSFHLFLREMHSAEQIIHRLGMVASQTASRSEKHYAQVNHHQRAIQPVSGRLGGTKRQIRASGSQAPLLSASGARLLFSLHQAPQEKRSKIEQE